MFNVKKTVITAKILLVLMVLTVISPLSMVFAVDAPIDQAAGISMDIKIIPTSVIVTPLTTTAVEGDPCIQYSAIAKYNYEGTSIPDKNITNDVLTVWSAVPDNGAVVVNGACGVGGVRPASDLGQGSASTEIVATYGNSGKDGRASITVRSETVVPSGGGGGGSSYTPPTTTTPPVETTTTTPPPEETPPPVETTTPPSEEAPPVETPPAQEPLTETPPPEEQKPVETTTETPTETTTTEEQPPVEQPGDQTTVTQETTSTTETPPTEQTTTETQTPGETTSTTSQVVSTSVAANSYVPLEKPVTAENALSLEEVFTPEELVVPPGGTSRKTVLAMIAEQTRILQLRSSLLNRCYADLPNCTNIFRMYSTFDGITLDPKNLKLFPDTEGEEDEKLINNLALLGVAQGYYGIKNSPFLPNKPISRIESLKLMTTILSILQKGDKNYVPDKFEYNTLFYREIYGASLLTQASQSQTALTGYMPRAFGSTVKVAHALTEQAWNLIKSQKTPFSDVRPDLYDSHWYYPIVLNKICPLELIDCKEGSQLKPDESPSEKQVNEYLASYNRYIVSQGYDQAMEEDDDHDQLLNIDENAIYFTDPEKADTDDDGLTDGEEVLTYKTDPRKIDSDGDGLNDGEEVSKVKTDPNLYDSDDDKFSDGDEVKVGTDPLDKNSFPADQNDNGVEDDWEAKYSLEVANGSQDSDGDGVSDRLEYIYNSDPLKQDTDMDGFTDSQELFELNSNPLDPNDPGDKVNTQVLISNYQYGQMVADTSPMIKGSGPASLGNNIVKVQILLRNEFGSEMMLGETQTDAQGGFIFVPDIEIKDGTYLLMARAIDKGQVYSSNPVKIIIDSTLAVAAAKPEKLENVPITDDVLLKKLTLKVDSKDGRPVLSGTLSEFGSRVNVTWQSLVVSSALIVDTTDGSFSIKAPVLPAGRHTVYIQTVRKRDNAVSKTIKITFDLGVIGGEKFSAVKKAEKGVSAAAAGVADFVKKQSWPFWVAILVVLTLVGGGVYFFVLGNDDDDDDKKSK
jgi:hypothetical protein